MKINLLKPFTGFVTLILIISCKIEPQAIEYGKDQCGFCSMNIVDKTHASQYVTTKGKQFKFDSIECMLNDLNKKNKEEIAVILVADFGNPGEMIKAKTASYLISEEIKSPMGANLSAFQSLVKAEELKQVHSGDIYNWTTLKEKFSKK
jgi:copper chaperone NosL